MHVSVDDDMTDAIEQDMRDLQVVQGLLCSPHFSPDPNRRVLKAGDIMYFIRNPGSFDAWCKFVIDRSYPVRGLDKEDSLKCLCDPIAFTTRLQELGELKAQSEGEQDAEKEAVTTYVKRRKLDSGRAQNVNDSEPENIAPPRRKKSGSQKRAAPEVSNKVAKANDLLSYFDLPCNIRAAKNALAEVFKKLRGALRHRISNSK